MRLALALLLSCSIAAADNAAAIVELRRAITDEYSHYGLRPVPWDQLFRRHQDALAAAATPKDFAAEAAALLAEAKDMHIHVESDGGAPIYPFQPPGTLNFELGVLKKSVPRLAGDRCAITGRFDDGIAYLTMNALLAPCAATVKAAFLKLDVPENRALIVDLRPNNGGDDRIAAWMAGCLVAKPVLYARIVLRAHGKLSSPSDRVLTPNPECPRFAGRSPCWSGPRW